MDLLNYIQKYPQYFIEAFCSCNLNIITPETFESLCYINWSEEGSNKQQTESRIIAFWKDYLQDCYGKYEFVIALTVLKFSMLSDNDSNDAKYITL